MCPVTGLLVLTQPAASIVGSLPRLLSAASKHVTRALYIHLDPLARTHLPETTPTLTLFSHIITSIYNCSHSLCRGLEVRVLLAGFKDCVPTPPKIQHPVDVLILEDMGQGKERLEVEKCYSGYLAADSQIVVLPEAHGGEKEGGDKMPLPISVPTDQVYPNVVLGGTFDRPHVGHLVMLSAALLRCRDRLVCGMADGPLLKKKTLTELIRPLEERMAGVVQLVEELDPSVKFQAMPIEEPLGPTRWDPHMEMIVVSEETKAGVAAINRVREEKGLRPLEGHVVSLVEEVRESAEEETKASSSSLRMRLLGTVLQEPSPNPTIPTRPYVIGLTGGSACGKSSVARRLAGLGAAVVDCDKLGHEAYLPGTACNKTLVDTFGPEIVDKDGHINRRALAARVFSSEAARQQLNSIVWPEIEQLVKQKVNQLAAEGMSVVVLDAAVLLEAGWDRLCHQVWVCVLRREESIRRITQRDGKTPEEAERRLDSQMAPREQVEKANVVLCTEWAEEYTQKQVERAWAALMPYLSQSKVPASTTTTTTPITEIATATDQPKARG